MSGTPRLCENRKCFARRSQWCCTRNRLDSSLPGIGQVNEFDGYLLDAVRIAWCIRRSESKYFLIKFRHYDMLCWEGEVAGGTSAT